jgi:hypothetical protein
MKLYLKDIRDYAFKSSEPDKIRPNTIYYDGIVTIKDIDSKIHIRSKWYLEGYDRKSACVYFLVDNEEVVYIGQTKTEYRPIAHKRDKKFTDIYYVPLRDPYHLKFEKKLLSKYITKYNKLYYNGNRKDGLKYTSISFEAIYNSLEDKEYDVAYLRKILRSIWKDDNINKILGNGVYFRRLRRGVYIKI